MTFRLPGLEQRLAVIGRTGSGKTQHAAWQLMNAPFHKQPYVIIDYKGDRLLNNIPYVPEIGLREIPRQPGLYIVKPEPADADKVEEWLRAVWKRERVGLFVDEMYEIPYPQKGGAMRSIFTQGRSKRIPVIACTQRPAWVSPFLFSEADFFAVFDLNTANDRQRIHHLTPLDMDRRMTAYHCRWYDVAANRIFDMSPVPAASEILETFEKRLAPRRRYV